MINRKGREKDKTFLANDRFLSFFFPFDAIELVETFFPISSHSRLFGRTILSLV